MVTSLIHICVCAYVPNLFGFTWRSKRKVTPDTTPGALVILHFISVLGTRKWLFPSMNMERPPSTQWQMVLITELHYRTTAQVASACMRYQLLSRK
jgi:hypothetical protein